jgi:L-seryl-tRNA(Ser) seleniumtransferase
MNETEGLLRSIPNVDRLLRNPIIAGSSLPRTVITDAVRQNLAELRARILAGEDAAVPADDLICKAALLDAEADYSMGIRPVVNGTGVILHSNLGRACLSYRASKAVFLASQSFSTLEYSLEEGRRGSRTAALEALLTKLTGAEAAIVVNNNAAAVLLILSAIAAGGDVVVSRGELVEIGGSFRVPEIMEQCGCRLREVGTTNKTRISDYESAVDEHVRALLKVHTSNFRVVGFTESVSVKTLAALGQKHGLPVIEDIGSGALVNMEKYGITGEPYAADSLKAGVDIISFSGDKLLGGPQAGIILGKEKYLNIMKKHPLYRALRVDKMTVAALEETLRAYHDTERAEHELPVLKMMSASLQELRSKAERLCILLETKGVAGEVVPVSSTPGSGAVPGCELQSYGVSIGPGTIGVQELDRRLHRLKKPVIGLVRERYLLDVRTMFETDLEAVSEAVAEALL